MDRSDRWLYIYLFNIDINIHKSIYFSFKYDNERKMTPFFELMKKHSNFIV